jgi:hypothetical protein
MNCPGCGVALQPQHKAQPVHLTSGQVQPPSFCDACCRSGSPIPGSPQSLERLVRGQVDVAERERLADALGDTGPLSEPISAVLTRAARAGGFEIPESAR